MQKGKRLSPHMQENFKLRKPFDSGSKNGNLTLFTLLTNTLNVTIIYSLFQSDKEINPKDDQ